MKDEKTQAWESPGFAQVSAPLHLRTDPFADMRDFMDVCGDELPHISEHSGEISKQVRRYVTLCGEEYEELCAAIEQPTRDLGEVVERLAEIGDAATDLIYVALGVMHSLGIPPEQVWRAVHSSNMTKRDAEGRVRRRLDGKILKPDTYRPPNIAAVISAAITCKPL
jgi:hypothetical protein